MSVDALLMVSFGGPEAPDEVMPFLERVTAGRGVPRERLEDVSQHYRALGGVSPLNAQNRALLAALRARLIERGLRQPIYWGNRNSQPFLADTLRRINADGHSRVLAWVTSAYASYSGCRQYREDLSRALSEARLQGHIVVAKTRHYFDHPGFIEPFAEGLAFHFDALTTQTGSTPQVLFVTHSVPIVMAQTSGPPNRRDEFASGGGAYPAQHRACARAVVARANALLAARRADRAINRWDLVYQSRSGAADVPWLEPDINDAIRSLHGAGAKGVVIVPIGFVSDHVEVIWDLDREARQTAEDLGMAFARAATPGTHPRFVDAIVDLFAEQIDGLAPAAVSPLGPWPARCAADCCPNLRGNRPTVAGAEDTP